MGQDTLKVGIVGSRKYENRKKIKDFIFKLKREKGSDTIVVGNGGRDGAGRYVKKYTLELGLQYQEFPPFHDNWNIYCPKNKSDYELRFLESSIPRYLLEYGPKKDKEESLQGLNRERPLV